MQRIPPTALARLEKLHDSVVRVIRGKSGLVDLVIAALLARGHVLLEDRPGVGKTTLARAVARSLNLRFRRIQFTSDTLPSDLIGISVYRKEREEFEFIRGPLFANVILADEINRATPRTQSALLEAMSEAAVTVDGVRMELPEPFLVIATQNPVEATGTYDLPESQMDRFLMRLSMGYPGREEELALLRSGGIEGKLGDLAPVLDAGELRELQRLVGRVHVEDSLRDFLLDVVERTRRSDELLLGVSTRGALAWQAGARALALLRGRTFLTPDELLDTALPILAHRVLVFDAEPEHSREQQRIIGEILRRLPLPR